MDNLLKTPLRMGGFLLAGAMLLSAQTQGMLARPGAVNYAEGQVTLGGQAVGRDQIGHVEVAAGQVLETQDGKAEMLLTPGVFLRLSDQSAVRMVSPSITDTRVELLRGEAMVEADQVAPENRLNVMEKGATTLIRKRGVYEFRANQPTVAVFDGKAEVQQDDRSVELGKDREVSLDNNPKLKAKYFDAKQTEASDPLYNWSKLRSEYVAEANASMAQTIVVGNPYWWYGTGWYWNPYFDSFAFMPGFGYMYSPFGYGFYSPAYWAYAGPFGYRGGYGAYGRGIYGRAYAAGARPAFGGSHFGGFGGGHFGGGGGGGGRR